MVAKFEIESVFGLIARGQIVIAAKRLDNVIFRLSDKSKLNDVPIENFTDIPKAHDKDGNIRYDLFVFILKNKEDKDKFVIGQVVELSP
ncbi:MAG TPA: hypothetical protein VF487_03240 [Chitinophagaceae bacterium]